MLFIHIGRGKAGSTSLQLFAARNRGALRRAGLIYPAIGRFHNNHMNLASDLTAGRDSNLKTLARLLEGDPHGRYLISTEHIFNLGAQGIARLLASASGHEVRIVAYIRNYATWLQSCYAQDTTNGRNNEDFDQYFERKFPAASVVPMLSRWAEAVGWERVRVRSLDPAGLSGGDLAKDFLEAVLESPPSEPMEFPGIRNSAPAWQVLELRRALAKRRGGRRASDEEARAERRVMKVFIASLKRSGAQPGAIYLTPDQIERVASLFNDDVDFLNRQTGARIPPLHICRSSERPFLPAFDHVPPAVRRAFLRRLGVRLAIARVWPIKESRNLPMIRRVRDSLRSERP